MNTFPSSQGCNTGSNAVGSATKSISYIAAGVTVRNLYGKSRQNSVRPAVDFPRRAWTFRAVGSAKLPILGDAPLRIRQRDLAGADGMLELNFERILHPRLLQHLQG